MTNVPGEIQVMIRMLEHNLKFAFGRLLPILRTGVNLLKLIARFSNIGENDFPVQPWHKTSNLTVAFSCGARSAFKLKEKGYLRNMLSRRQLQGFVSWRQYLKLYVCDIALSRKQSLEHQLRGLQATLQGARAHRDDSRLLTYPDGAKL